MANRIPKIDLLTGVIIILIFVGFSHTRPSLFEGIERAVYDAEIRFAIGEKKGVPKVVLINVDDKSLVDLGSWPWPRHYIAEMVEILRDGGAKIIGLNVPLFEKEANPGLGALKSFREKFEAFPFSEKEGPLATWIEEYLEEMEDNLDGDRRLVESVQRSGNVVLPASVQFGHIREGSERRGDSQLSKHFLTPLQVSASLERRLSANHLSLPFPELEQQALGVGHTRLTLENAMAGRSHPVFVNYKGSLLPSFPLRLAIAYENLQPKQVVVADHEIRLKGQIIPISRGELLIRFPYGQDPFPQYPFVDLLKVKQAPPILRGKIALVGFNARESRHFSTPVAPNMSEGEFIGNILENIISNTFIRRPPLMSLIETFCLILLSGMATILLPRMDALSRMPMAFVLIALPILAGVILLVATGTWFKVTYMAGAIITIYVATSLRPFFSSRGSARDSTETNRLLGLSFQSQGLLDLAFEKFRRLPVDNETKDLIYNLGLEYERKRMLDKALIAYQYISKWGGYRDLDERISQLQESDNASTIGSYGDKREMSILADTTADTRSRVGRYDIVEELGKGSMGQVYKALDPKINRLLAIKTIRFSDEFEEDLIQEIKERFFREAEIAGQLSHPSIVTVYDVGEDRDLTYMAMEFLEGVNLEKYVTKENLLPLRKALEVISEVADALDFAHKADVIHRDIKPANIMLLEKGGIKVTDFGIAKAISSSRTKTGVILGTPNYMSPEQIMGQKMDLRSDIFSLGVLLFQLLTGELPFQGENLSSLLYQITQVSHPSVRSYSPKIPRVCEQILDKALAKDPKDRFSRAGEMGRVIRLLVSKIDEFKRKKTLKSGHFGEA